VSHLGHLLAPTRHHHHRPDTRYQRRQGGKFPGAQVYPRVRRLSREHRPKLRLAHHPCSRGQNGTIGHVAYEGGDLERVREERDNSIRELRARGLSIRKIASLLDCKKSTVCDAIHALPG
jgi:hypothetical protein